MAVSAARAQPAGAGATSAGGAVRAILQARDGQHHQQRGVDGEHRRHQPRHGVGLEPQHHERDERGPDEQHRAAAPGGASTAYTCSWSMASTVPRAANTHSSPSTSPNSAPPTKIIATPDSSSAAATASAPRAPMATRLRTRARCRRFGGRHVGEGDHHDELREEQHHLGHDQAGRVEPRVVLVEHVARDDDVDAGQGEEDEQHLGVVRALHQHGAGARAPARPRRAYDARAAPTTRRAPGTRSRADAEDGARWRRGARG